MNSKIILRNLSAEKLVLNVCPEGDTISGRLRWVFGFITVHSSTQSLQTDSLRFC